MNISKKLKLTLIEQSWWMTGFADAESCFKVVVFKSPSVKTGWGVRVEFSIELHSREIALLEIIQSFFGGVGSIKKNSTRDSVVYSITKIKDITAVIIPHFNMYPLVSQKRSDFLLFSSVVDLMNKKEHLTREGLLKILAIKASVNRGLSNDLKEAFGNDNIIPVERPKVEPSIIDPYWLTGFVDGDGCFSVMISKSDRYKTGGQVLIRFYITQHTRDVSLLKSFISYFGNSGYVTVGKELSHFTVSNLSEIENKIVPHFNKYRLLGLKKSDYDDWLKIVSLVKDKAHLTLEGFNKISQIRLGMNKGRYNSIS